MILFLLIVIFAAGYILYQRLPDIVTKRVEQQIINQLDPQLQGWYNVKVEEALIGQRFSNIILPRISIYPDFGHPSLQTDTLLPRQFFGIKTYDISISSDGILDLALGRSTSTFSKIAAGKIHLTIYANDHGKTMPREREQNTGGFRINEIEARKVDFEYRQWQDTTIVLAGSGNMQLNGALSLTPADTIPFSIEYYSITADSAYILPVDGKYHFHSGPISARSNDHVINIADVKILPIFGKQEMGNYFAYQTDRTDMIFQNVTIGAADLNDMISKRRFIVDVIRIENGGADVFRDRNFPLDTLRRPLMPSRMLRSAEFDLSIREVVISNTRVQYSERPDGKSFRELGTVPVAQIEGTIRNITNITSELKADSIMHIDFSGRLFGDVQLQANFIYNLQDLNGGFRARGTAGPVDLRKVNEALVPIAGVTVTSGRHIQSHFHFIGNDIRSQGELKMIYSDLELQVNPDGGRLQRGVTRLLGRNLVYHPSNPGRRDEERTGTIDFERDPTRSLIHYWWQSYLSGIKNTVLRDNIPIP
jgi:hypothetical protein